jgi:hypothetical protein
MTTDEVIYTIEIAEKTIETVKNAIYTTNDKRIFDNLQVRGAICNVLDEIERITINEMKRMGILTMIPYNVFEYILVYAGECLFCDYNTQYIYFTEQYKITMSIIGDLRNKEIENEYYREHGPNPYIDRESPLKEIIQAEQYILWATQVNFGDDDEKDIIISQNMYDRCINATKAIEKVEKKALKEISILINIPIILLNIVAEFINTKMFCDYKSQYNYLTRIAKANAKANHKYRQKSTIQSDIYIRDFKISLYEDAMKDIESKKQSIAKSIPCLNSIYPPVLYKNRYINDEKTIAYIIIDYLEMSDFGHDTDILCKLYGKIHYYHKHITENEVYFKYYDRNIIIKDNEYINYWLLSTSFIFV